MEEFLRSWVLDKKLKEKKTKNIIFDFKRINFIATKNNQKKKISLKIKTTQHDIQTETNHKTRIYSDSESTEKNWADRPRQSSSKWPDT